MDPLSLSQNQSVLLSLCQSTAENPPENSIIGIGRIAPNPTNSSYGRVILEKRHSFFLIMYAVDLGERRFYIATWKKSNDPHIASSSELVMNDVHAKQTRLFLFSLLIL